MQPVVTDGFRAARRGETGVVSATDYLGNKELEAYAPLNIPDSDLHWSILATRDDSDAFAGLGKFSKTLVIAVTTLVFVICVASMLIAQAAMGPVRRLEEGTRKISCGDYNIDIPVMARDEIGDLTAAFNEMSRNLAIKEQLLNEQRNKNNRLLLALMPESIVQRYRDGEATIAQKHQDVMLSIRHGRKRQPTNPVARHNRSARWCRHRLSLLFAGLVRSSAPSRRQWVWRLIRGGLRWPTSWFAAGLLSKDPAVVAAVLADHAAGTAPSTIGRRHKVHHSTVGRFLAGAEDLVG
ncbi:MAG: cyclase [Mycobacterium sp.]|nr:cyclase [Mycobacterium sp.]